MKRKLLHFTNHLGKPAAVRAEDVLYIQMVTPDPDDFPDIEITEILTYNKSTLIAQETAEELIKALSEIIEQ